MWGQAGQPLKAITAAGPSSLIPLPSMMPVQTKSGVRALDSYSALLASTPVCTPVNSSTVGSYTNTNSRRPTLAAPYNNIGTAISCRRAIVGARGLLG